jgi:predicted Rossmann-fold nucleotide-binding protein
MADSIRGHPVLDDIELDRSRAAIAAAGGFQAATAVMEWARGQAGLAGLVADLNGPRHDEAFGELLKRHAARDGMAAKDDAEFSRLIDAAAAGDAFAAERVRASVPARQAARAAAASAASTGGTQ